MQAVSPAALAMWRGALDAAVAQGVHISLDLNHRPQMGPLDELWGWVRPYVPSLAIIILSVGQIVGLARGVWSMVRTCWPPPHLKLRFCRPQDTREFGPWYTHGGPWSTHGGRLNVSRLASCPHDADNRTGGTTLVAPNAHIDGPFDVCPHYTCVCALEWL